jgi:hypothetical protein
VVGELNLVCANYGAVVLSKDTGPAEQSRVAPHCSDTGSPYDYGRSTVRFRRIPCAGPGQSSAKRPREGLCGL